MNLTLIRAGLETALSTAGLRVYSEWPDKPEAPAACIRPDDPYVEPDQTSGSQYLMAVNFIVDVIVTPVPGADRAQIALDGLIAETIPNALNAAKASANAGTLGGAAEDVHWNQTSGLRSVPTAASTYMGVEVSVTVRARHS